ncbi:hypothetical protein L873DRAFT_365525 [Choiromyces venosus 120613-1]|uniref:Uncharacterized protein n=1 Tax=Choiromyces venosus 120613-1 TaxID=1336337 RepID=A0A3N4K0L6_9PEZI|nr:hypothetical protein L873DRAFT_365525 [Choiromyces venosus 120613-1]
MTVLTDNRIRHINAAIFNSPPQSTTVTHHPSLSPTVPCHPTPYPESSWLTLHGPPPGAKTAVLHSDCPGRTTDSRPVLSRPLGSPPTGPLSGWVHWLRNRSSKTDWC